MQLQLPILHDEPNDDRTEKEKVELLLPASCHFELTLAKAWTALGESIVGSGGNRRAFDRRTTSLPEFARHLSLLQDAAGLDEMDVVGRMECHKELQ